MSTETDGPKEEAIASTVRCINKNKNLDSLVHDMLHRSKSVDDYLKRLEGLIRLFWGTSTPENQSLDEVTWLHVMVQILPKECLIPIFNDSMLELEGKDMTGQQNTECEKYPT